MKEQGTMQTDHSGQSSDLSAILNQLDYRGNLKFRFAAIQYNSIGALRDYGDGEYIKMLDAHILKDIDENPGILSVELAQSWCRTRSAICVIIQRLQDGGYITKRSIDGNKKERALFSTEKGHRLCDLHRRYDAMQTSALINDMLSFCTADEIDAYFKVLDYQIRAMQRGYGQGSDGVPFFSYNAGRPQAEGS